MSSSCPEHILQLPGELQVNVLTYLRAYDLTSLQLSCKFYASKELIHAVVTHFANNIYPPEWTHGFDKSHDPSQTFYTLQTLRDMELLLVARILSRPEPTSGLSGFYVSKSWCKTALKWLEVQQTTAAAVKKKKKLSKKQERIRQRRLSDALPPWPNANSDILCVHQNLQRCTNNKNARARRKLLDRQAWKILKKLYPDSTQLDGVQGECIQCVAEAETAKKNEQDRIEKLKVERKKPLACPIVRRFYTRTRGFPTHCLKQDESKTCPLLPGLYHVVPRVWCHEWRRYIKSGEGGCPPTPPDSSSLLCDAHRLPLISPHLQAFLCGATKQLLATKNEDTAVPAVAEAPPSVAVGQNYPQADANMAHQLIAAGIPDADLASQRRAMLQLERQQQQTREQLDRENSVVVEIITEEESCALQALWDSHPAFSLRFSLDEIGDFTFSTPPCRECDASGLLASCGLSIKNRARVKKKKPSGDSPRQAGHVEY